MRGALANQLVEVVEKRISLDAFELWLVGHLQLIIDEGDANLRAYADKLDALFIQFGEQAVSRGELVEAFEDILRNLNTIMEPSFDIGLSVSVSTADSEHIEMPIRDLGAVQDLHPPVLVLA